MKTECCLLNTARGAVAQLGERFNGIEEVVGSNPISSTTNLGFEISDLGFGDSEIANLKS